MDWEYIFALIGAVGAGAKASAYVVLPSELNADYTDPTLMASRMISGLNFGAGSAAGAEVVFGLIAWDDLNDTPPIGAECPGPITNGNLDWILRQVHYSFGGAGSSTVLAGDGATMSKARRRLGSSRGILLVQENSGGAVTTASSVDVRCLIKE